MRCLPEKGDFREDHLLRTLLFDLDRARDLLTGDGITPPPLPSYDWPLFLRKAVREGVAPLIFHQLRRHRLEDCFPPACRRDLANIYQATLKRNLSLIVALRRALSAFQSAGIPCIVLKGMVLAERVYPNLALRGMSDVDVLIRKEDLFRADAVLAALGYTSRDATAAVAINNPVGYLASLEYRKAETAPLNLNLHLHWHPVNTSVPATAFVDGIDLDRLWEKAVETEVADSPVLMLCPEHLIIYLCEHALRVGHSFDRLILVCDIYFTIRAFANRIDWEFLVRESRRFGLSRFVYHGLTIVRHHTVLDILDESIATLKPLDLSWGEKFFLHLQLNNRRIKGSSYLLYLAMNRSFAAKIRFIARTFFPPRQILLQRRYGKDSDSTKSYYLSRVGEVLSHVFGFFTPDRTKMIK